jgi:hypothetical protein
MNISRRHFLLGTAGAAAGLILPGYYRRALEFIDRTGRPLLETVSRPKIELTAYQGDWDGLPWKLAVGDPFAGPQEMTLRQFQERYDIDLAERWYWEEDDAPDVDLDQMVDWREEFFWDAWVEAEFPPKLAYELLRDLDLGPDFEPENAVGHLDLKEGYSMVSTYWVAEAADEVSLSLLQERLNALKTGVQVKVLGGQ